MPVGRGSSKVRSPFALLLSLETVICLLALTSIAIVFPLTTRQREHLRLYYTATLRRLGHGPATHEQREWTAIQHNVTAFRMKVLGVALDLGTGRVDIPI